MDKVSKGKAEGRGVCWEFTLGKERVNHLWKGGWVGVEGLRVAVERLLLPLVDPAHGGVHHKFPFVSI